MTNFFAANRERLFTKLRGGLVVVPAYSALQRSNDIAMPFEQEANFWWLTGIDLPDWWLVIDGTRNKSWLIAPEGVTKNNRVCEEVLLASGVDGVETLDTGMQLLRNLAKKHSIVRTVSESRSEHVAFATNPAPRKTYDTLSRMFNTVQDCRRELAQLRAIKQPEEIARIKKATNLTISAFEHVNEIVSEAKYEYEIEAELEYFFRKNGAMSSAYDSVVASGKNASDLRYVANNKKLKKRELILIDAGARLQGYAAGITRTYCYGGEPTKRQLHVHAVLQRSRAQILDLISPDLAVDHYQRDVDTIMQEALIELGLMADRNDLAAYRHYFPHAISHGVGVDAHDSLGKPHFLQENMVLTVEPGVYIPEEGIGMRFADTVVITSSGITNLTTRLSTDL